MGNGDVCGSGCRLSGWGVDDPVVSAADYWITIVVELASIGVVGKEFLEELFASGRILSLGTWFTVAMPFALAGSQWT